MKLNEVDKFILENISQNPHDIVAVASEHFKKGRTTILYRLRRLINAEYIIQEGSRNKVTYTLNVNRRVSVQESNFVYDIGKAGEDEIWRKDINPLLTGIKDNVLSIARYGFTEMFNNVIDHSNGKKAQVSVEITASTLKMTIIDDGIGVFKNVANFFGISDLRDAVVRLHQGKVTTYSSRHTGQGIFFTSRAFDQFTLVANGFAYHKDNSIEDDWFLEWRGKEAATGTAVELEIALESQRVLRSIFDKFSNPEDLSFDSSHIRISLSVYEEDQYVSRSQAKRLLEGLANFRSIDLDFKDIRSVGQAFVDEVFGVFGTEHPHIHFNVINANEEVLFMIRRGIKDRNFPPERVHFAEARSVTN